MLHMTTARDTPHRSAAAYQVVHCPATRAEAASSRQWRRWRGQVSIRVLAARHINLQLLDVRPAPCPPHSHGQSHEQAQPHQPCVVGPQHLQLALYTATAAACGRHAVHLLLLLLLVTASITAEHPGVKVAC